LDLLNSALKHSLGWNIEDVKAAVAHAAQGKRSGKIIFEFGE